MTARELGSELFSIVVARQHIPVPGVPDGATWLDDRHRAPPITDGRARDAERVTGIVIHTSRGVRGHVRPGALPSSRAELLALYQSRTTRDVSWHFTIDTDGTVIQQADAALWMCWHAGHANGWSVGIELVQQPGSGDLYEVQIASMAAIVEALCGALRIPRRTPVGADGRPWAGLIAEHREASEGGRQRPFAGVLGHRALTDHRGPGDPGDDVFAALLARGFEGVTVSG